MAKKPARGERSQAVRDYLAKNPTANVKSVVEGLAAEGIKVSGALVGSIKYTKGKKARRARRQQVRAMAVSEGVDLQRLIAVKRLANDFGGLNEVKKIVAALEKLQ